MTDDEEAAVNHKALMQIMTLLDRREWKIDDLDTIARIVTDAGYPVSDVEDEDGYLK